jgi:hypothetical protein
MATIPQSLRNPDGSVNTAAVYDLLVGDLRAWIDKRLSGEDPYLPLGRSEELPHTLLLQLFEAADPTHPFRERLQQSIRQMLVPVLNGSKAPGSPAWLGEALLLAFAVGARLPRETLRRAFESKRFSAGAYLESGADIGLLDLLAIQDGLEPVGFWYGLLDQPRHALSAFLALERYGPEAVVRGLPVFMATIRRATPETERVEPRLALALKRMVERFSVDRLLPFLETRLAEPDQVIVQEALRLVGIPMTLTEPAAGVERLDRDQIAQAMLYPDHVPAYQEMTPANSPFGRRNGRPPDLME